MSQTIRRPPFDELWTTGTGSNAASASDGLDYLLGLGQQLGRRASWPDVEHWFSPGSEVSLQDALIPLLLSIRDRRGRLVSLQPNGAQRRFAAQRTERNIVLKARQVGITTYIAARFFLATILRPGTVTLQVAHSLESAQQIFRIVHRFAQTLPPKFLELLRIARANVRELAFAFTDSRYVVETAGNANAGRGLTVHNLHASEVALWPGDPHETMAALQAAVVPGGVVEIESTPNGMGGYFHTEWLRARAGDGFTPHFFPWWIEPGYRIDLSPGEELAPLDDREHELAEQVGLTVEQIKFRRHLRRNYGDLAPQEFAETDADCFLVSGRPVFDVAAIDARIRHAPPPRSVLQNGAEVVWLEPISGRSYIVGADVAEGVGRGDFSAAAVVDAQTGLQCAELLERWPIARFAEELARVGRRYNHALIAVERNNQGHAVLYALRHQFHYSRLYVHLESASGVGGAPARKEGWPMNAATKPRAMMALANMLRDAPEAFASKRLLEQCRSYAYGDSGEMGARPGLHDDLVIAMAIALAVRARAGDVQLAAARL